MDKSNDQIEKLAYQLWEEAGKPEGKSEEFWLQACQQLQGQCCNGNSAKKRRCCKSK